MRSVVTIALLLSRRNVANSAGVCAEKRKSGAEKRKSGAEKRTIGAEKRTIGAEKRKSGAEKRKSGAEKRNCTLGPPYSGPKEQSFLFSAPLSSLLRTPVLLRLSLKLIICNGFRCD